MTTDRERFRELLTAKVITHREHEILELRFHHHFSQVTTARALGLSRSTIRSTEQNALDKIARYDRKDAA